MEKSSLKSKFVPLLAIVAICVFAYFSYSTYWLVKTIPWIIDISLNPKGFLPPTGLLVTTANSLASAYAMEYAGFLGLILRFVGASYALAAVFLILKNGKGSITKQKSKIYAALILNGLYFFSFIPVIFYLLNFSALPSISNKLLSTTLLSQLALISPFLLFLAYRIRKPALEVHSGSWWKLVGLASLAYIIAIWITYMSKWNEMMAVDPYLFSAFSVRIMGFLNTVIVQSLAVVFAVAGTIGIFRRASENWIFLLWGLATVLLGLHTTIYTIYCYSVGIPRFIGFGELWQIPAIAFGFFLMFLAYAGFRLSKKGSERV